MQVREVSAAGTAANPIRLFGLPASVKLVARALNTGSLARLCVCFELVRVSARVRVVVGTCVCVRAVCVCVCARFVCV